MNSTIGTQLGGGTAERTYQLSKYIARKPNIRCQILVHDIDLNPQRVAACSPAKVISISTVWKRFYVPMPELRKICQAVKVADVIHLMGHWTILNAIVYILVRYYKKPYVFCPAGALPLFGRSLILKRIYNFFIGNAIVKNATSHIAITEKEVKDFLTYGIDLSNIKIIPNGVDIDYKVEVMGSLSKTKFLNKFNLPPTLKYILFMGRLNSIKGPDILLDAFAQVKDKISGFNLIYCGPDGGLLSQLRKRSIELGLQGLVHFVGYVDGDIKAGFYRYAELLVVPSRQEAMSIVALEAGIFGRPALVSSECGLPEIRQIHDLLEAPAEITYLRDSLLNLISQPEMLNQMGIAWRKYVIKKYSWDIIADSHLNLFASLISSKR